MLTRVAVTLTVLFTLAQATLAQDIIHYKFDEGGGAKLINYAARPGIAPQEGIITTTKPALPTRTTGKFSGALRGYGLGEGSRIAADTGWNADFSGSFTVAMFLKGRSPVASTGQAFFLASDNSTGKGISAAVNGQDGGVGLYLAGRVHKSSVDFRKLSWGQWAHVAFVVDATTRYVTVYVDGTAEIPEPTSFNGRMYAGEIPLRIGNHFSTTYGSFDVDEFRLRLGTATAAEIKKWATENPAADGAYGQGCWPKGRPVLLDSNADKHGAPVIGNTKYAFELYGLPGSAYIFALGTNRLRFGSIALPLDLGFLDPALKGCGWETSTDLAQFPGVIGSTGKAILPFPIPNNPGLTGVTVYSQAVLYSATLKRWMASNAFATSAGK